MNCENINCGKEIDRTTYDQWEGCCSDECYGEHYGN